MVTAKRASLLYCGFPEAAAAAVEAGAAVAVPVADSAVLAVAALVVAEQVEAGKNNNFAVKYNYASLVSETNKIF